MLEIHYNQRNYKIVSNELVISIREQQQRQQQHQPRGIHLDRQSVRQFLRVLALVRCCCCKSLRLTSYEWHLLLPITIGNGECASVLCYVPISYYVRKRG